ncbi:uncharacterized protein LOC131247959 [Magnolia sinica]|uniref:uncharacterized protein LOC131247959 n=1 Tax=Magnolia sinica TaxID=86752 RepID=UPI0026589DCB|nr:uncharacterized protein LOC131247959 [Magnolia sinica]
MEEIHQAGQVHFANASHEENDLITAMFKSMDLDNDGRISKSESLELMKRDMPTNEASCLFTKLDQDRSGSLDFDEFKTHYYASISRPICDYCKKLVTGMYYCCVRCWEMHMTDGHELHRRFQVCAQCYSNKLFQHSHEEFLDNYMLLFRSKEILAAKTEKKVKVNPEAMEVKAALKAGRLFYRSLPDKNDAYNLFAVMDRNGDGDVSETEVIDFLTNKGMPRADACKLFKGTNLGRDGYLSIEDIAALWYISVMHPYCARCKARIMGTCYSCFECHNVSMLGYDNNTYDLCPECYSKGEIWHEHDFFLDNFALLQIKTLLLRQRTAMSSNGGGQEAGTSYSGGRVMKIMSKSEVLTIMADIASVVGAVCAVGAALAAVPGCSIM